MSTEVAIPSQELQLTPQQQGWLKLASMKSALFADLEKAELAVQGQINLISVDKPLTAIGEALVTAKNTAAAAKEQRLGFTNMLNEKLVAPAMAFEKRSAELISGAEKIELEARKIEAAKIEAINAKNKEKAALQAHITNQYYAIAQQFRNRLYGYIAQHYQSALATKLAVENVEQYKAELIQLFAKEPTPPMVKFNRALVTDAEALEIFKNIPVFERQPVIEAAVAELHSTFAMYDQDLANAEAAIQASKKHTEQQAAQQSQAVAIQQAVNTIAAVADTPTIEGPKIKKVLKVKEENTTVWLTTVLGLFHLYMPHLLGYLRVKDFAKLNVGQMAEALAKMVNETGELLPGLKMEEVCK